MLVAEPGGQQDGRCMKEEERQTGVGLRVDGVISVADGCLARRGNEERSVLMKEMCSILTSGVSAIDG